MASNSESQGALSPTKLALRKIRDLKRQLAEAQHGQSGDIAIVSMACRFPRKSNTPEAFWQTLVQGTDEASEIPSDRWDLDAYFDEDPDAPGKMYARKGVFLDELDQMDPDFFGISPREATWVDPQQRMLLEVSWEALERAGWAAEKINQETGLFVGWMHNDYQNESSDSLLNLNPYIATGSAGSFLCGRLSYYLGLQGPSLAVDTACSSSLVALHLACQSLNNRECNQALVGGVNAIVSPTTNILTCKLKALSPQGNSLAFDARADGYLRGEGCGVVALRRLADAKRDGDPILAVILGSAVGHNGFSSGLTAPNPQSQQRVIRDALERAGVAPVQVDYLEAHGTGTELGDPIEMHAAAAVLGKDRDPEYPLLVGSVKTNIGHLEAAAGMAGLIKVLLALQNETIPAQLNFQDPNPHIPWNQLPVEIVVEAKPWPNDRRRIAGVSAFGMSGTNAHVVLEGPPSPAPDRHGTSSNGNGEDASHQMKSDSPFHLLPLSAKTEDALHDLTTSYRRWLQVNPEAELRDVAYTCGAGRRHFDARAALVANSAQHAEQLLRELERSGEASGVFRGQHRAAPMVAWQFTGQGSQYAGMAQGLYESQPVFRAAVDDCEQLLAKWRQGSLLDALFNDQDLIHHTSWTQPALFAIQMGLVRLLQHWGLRPDVVLGHSVGQYAAACVAGVMSWQEGLRLISERGRLIGQLPGGGAMLAVFASPDQVQAAIANDDDVSLAALNGSHTVISGPEGAIERLAGQFSHRSVRCQRLTTSHAFHSAMMDPALEPFQDAADQVQYRAATLPLVCNISGQPFRPERILTGEYWRQQIREPVRYAESIQAVKELGCELLLEIGPQPVLTRMAPSAWPGSPPGLISCLQKDANDGQSLLSAVAEMYVRGVTPDFAAIDDSTARRVIVMPTYPFQRQRFWGPPKPQAYHAEVHLTHPLLGGRRPLAGLPNESRYESWISADEPKWLIDHQVMGDIVVPGAAFVEMALAATPSSDLQNLVFDKPLRPSTRMCMQTIVREKEQQPKTIELYASPEESSLWTRHFTAEVSHEQKERPAAVDWDAVANRCTETIDASDFYQMMQGLGLQYGPEFQTVKSLQLGDADLLVRLETTGDLRGFTIPPTLLDGAFHALAAGLMRDQDAALFLPVGIERFQCFSAIESAAWCHATWNQADGEVRTADLTLFNDQGQVAARVENLQVRQLNRAALRQIAGAGPQRLLHELQWRPSRLPSMNKTACRWLVVSRGNEDEHALAPAVLNSLKGLEQHVIHVGLVGDAPNVELSAGAATIAGDQSGQWGRLLDHFADEAGGQCDGVVWLLSDESDDGSTPPAHPSKSHCSSLLALLSALRERDVKHLPRGLQLVTRSAISVADPRGSESESVETVDPHQAQYWGLARVIGAELPALGCRLIDVAHSGAGSFETDVASLIDVLMNDTQENQISIRDGRVFVARLASFQPANDSQAEFSVSTDGSYLITGGLGMLGRQAALWLAHRGAKHVVLTSRRPPNDAAQKVLEQIESLGCRAHVHQGDVSVRDEVMRLVETFGESVPPLRGVIHTAGVLDDALLSDQTWERFEAVAAPKAHGAQFLHELTADLPLDFFILYSSAASVLGSPGQSNYATANAFLDGLAWQRQAMGLPALSVNWGPWTEGMADNEMIRKRLALQGITPLAAAESHQALEKLICAGATQATVLDVDWRRMRMSLADDAPPLLYEIAPAANPSRGGNSALVEKLRKLQGAARKTLLTETVQMELQQVLSMSAPPDPHTPVSDMGLDSLMAVEFSSRLQALLGDDFAIAPTLLFDYPTVATLADHLLELVTDLPEGEAEQESPPVVHVPAQRDDVAIIGMSCRFPGAANVEQYWQNLVNGVDAVSEIPTDRWEVDEFYSSTPAAGKMYTREGGFLEDIGDFDAEFFNIGGQEACWIDPQHRLMLEVSWEALEDAGISTHPLVDSRVGVFMGIMSQDYAQLYKVDDIEVIDGFQGAGLAHSAGVGRISYMLGFEGPSIAVDTASSSSLVAVCQATKSLRDGDCNIALAGGVNAILTPSNSLLLCKAKMLSPDGRCKSFSAAANGFGRGEGCGVIVLKRRRDAERDGDQILAVIRGSAVGHNGFSGGLTSPNSRSQERVIRAALDSAGVQPTDVQYLEAHGTGTELGDPIEIRAAAKVFGQGRSADNPLLVGSVKANIGHLEAAGGISGLIKTVLTMQHGEIPGQLHFDEPSPHVPWDRIPLRVVSKSTAWPTGSERVAAVNALGMSGTNAHIVLSAPGSDQEPESMNEEPCDQLLVLSARTEPALRRLAGNYHRLFDQNRDLNITDVCYTSATGRRHFEHRAALVVNSADQAQRSIASLIDDRLKGGVYAGHSRSAPKLAWLFGDAAPSPPHVGRAFCESAPVFRDTLAQCDQHLQHHVQQVGNDEFGDALMKSSLAQRMMQRGEGAWDDHAPHTGVFSFAVQMALARLWQSWGIEADVVLGIGVGQYSAACVAGVMSLEDGMKLVAAREQVQATVSAGVAANVVQQLGNGSEETALNDFESFADTIDYFPADRPLICSLTGAVVPVHRLLGGAYWRRHCIESPHLDESIHSLAGLDCRVVLELGIGTAAIESAKAIWPKSVPVFLPSLVSGQDERARMLASLGQLYVKGVTPNFAGLYEPGRKRKVSLPTYPFERSRYWITDVAKHARK